MSVSLLLIVVSIYNLLLAVVVFRKTRHRRFGGLFAWTLFGVAGWTAGTAFTVFPEISQALALASSRGTFFCSACFSICILWFTAVFPFVSRRQIIIALLLTLPGLPLMGLSWTDAYITAMPAQPWCENVVIGRLFPLFGLWVMVTTATAILFLARKLAYTRGVERSQVGYILTGLICAWVGGATYNLLLPYFAHSTTYAASGPLSSLFFTTAASYAILRYRLMDIRIILRVSLIYSLTIGLLSVLYIALYQVIFLILRKVLTDYFFFPVAFMGMVLSLSIVALFFPLLQGIQEFVNRYLFKLVDHRQILRETSQDFASVRACQPIIEVLTTAIARTLRPLQTAVFLPNSTGVLESLQPDGAWDLLPDRLPDADPVAAYAIHTDDVLVTDELLGATAEVREIGLRLRDWNVSVTLPLVAGKQLCGLVLLGEKRSGSVYSRDDIGLLRILSKQAAMALENAHHYEALRRANMQLEERVHERTQQLAIANEQLEQTNAALETERAYLSAAIEILPLPIFFRAQDRTVQLSNKALQDTIDITGTLPEMSGVQLCEPGSRTPLPGDAWPGVRALKGEVISAIELLLVKQNGDELPILGHAGPIYRGDEVVASVVAFQDISALKAADKAKDEFLAVLSHELKTPLTCILAWAEVAHYDTEPAIIEKSLGIIKHNALRQRHLLNDLLDVSRIIHHKLLLHPESTDLWEITQQSVDDLEQAILERGISLVLQSPATPLPIYADPARIAQVITNLLNNALKFTEPGGTITVSGLPEDEGVLLRVEDTGRGIPPELLPDLFKPFRQVERIESNGGLGLGLALVKGITELHGGQVIAVSPGVGQGSIFTVRLPLAHPADAGVEETTSLPGAPTSLPAA